mmetsp:Transcript_486/g.1580  ORF Transcript_486/g.1580 Transcript_486/m.1580 type:complete len:201 (-) Transcript_486:623-1225(-)
MALASPPHHLVFVLPREGWRSSEHEEHHTASSKYIDLKGILVTQYDLRGNIAQGAYAAGELLCATDLGCNTKVGEHGPAISGNQDIFGLHITMHDRMVMYVSQGKEKAVKHVRSIRFSARSMLHAMVKQITSRSIVQHHANLTGTIPCKQRNERLKSNHIRMKASLSQTRNLTKYRICAILALPFDCHCRAIMAICSNHG